MIEEYLIDKLNNGQTIGLATIGSAEISGSTTYVGKWLTDRIDCSLFESVTLTCDSVTGQTDPTSALTVYLYESPAADEAYDTYSLTVDDITDGHSLTVDLPAAAKYIRLRGIGNMADESEVDVVFSHISISGRTAGILTYMEEPEQVPESYVILEKTAGREDGDLCECTIAAQSYGPTMLSAVRMNETTKKMMNLLNYDNAIGRCSLDSDYNFTDTSTHRYRYQAVFDISYYKHMV